MLFNNYYLFTINIYQVLCQGEFAWEFCNNGEVPADAIIAGQTADGEPLYIGRVLHNGTQTIGKVSLFGSCMSLRFKAIVCTYA